MQVVANAIASVAKAPVDQLVVLVGLGAIGLAAFTIHIVYLIVKMKGRR